MREHAAIVIAALMITSMAFAISTSSVSASHERTASIDDDSVKGDTSMIRVITIANDGPDAINRVEIIVPDGWGIAPTMKIPKDNEVELKPEKVVTLKAGTIVKPAGTPTVVIPADTPGIRLTGTEVWRVRPLNNENYQHAILLENASVEVWPSGGAATGLTAIDNIKLNEPIEVTLTGDNKVRLVNDTRVVVADGEVRLPEDTLVELVDTADTDDNLKGENVTLQNEVTLALDDNRVRLTAPVLVELTGAAAGSQIIIGPPGDNELELYTPHVVVPIGTVVRLDTTTAVTVEENTEMIVKAEKYVVMPAGTEAENEPKNWSHAHSNSTLPPGENAVWAGIVDNQIASGESLDFPFAFTPLGTGDYTIYVRTKDTKGVVVQTEITLTTDNTPPTVEEIAVSPEWAKAKTKVTITVTASEPLAKFDNVMVAENDATENTQVTMTPNADKTVWTGTYTTENEDYENDGTATVYVIGEQYEDLIGNAGSGVDNATFTVDRLAPTTPDLSTITGFPVDNVDFPDPDVPGIQTNTAVWFIENEAEDNFLGNLVPLERGTVKIRVGTTVYTLTPAVSGYYSKSITLTEGTQEVGIQYIDRAGNAGEENAENVTLDTIGPSIKWGKIAGKALVDGIQINTKAPTITLTISDAGLGVDNIDFNGDNIGYSVQLWDADKTQSILAPDNLVNALAHDNNVLDFENALPELGDNTYYIYAVAGDKLQMDNALIEFVIDTHAPSAPKVDAAYLIESTVDAPLVVKDASRTIAGTAEPGADITVYGTVDTTEKVLDTATAGSDEKWTATFTLTAGQNTKIEVSATDEAGNEGSRELYGWMLADASAPSVTLDELPEATDKTSITISGTVSKDAWEDWSEITLKVQVGTGIVTVPIGAGGSYDYSLELAEGPNTIVVQATDDVGNPSATAHAVVERTVTPWMTYAIILVIIALLMAVIAIFRK